MSEVHPSAVISKAAELGNDVIVGPNSVVDDGAVIGDGSRLDANVVIGKGVNVGRNNTFYANSVIGRNPQMLGGGLETRTGRLEIGDNNTIREQVTIHPSIYEDEKTVIGNNNLLMIGVHIGHDCVLEDDIVMSNFSQISGHCKVETGVWLSGMVLVHQFITIGKWCYAAGFSGINHDVPPFVMLSGHYPPQVRALNKRGMSRAGLTDEQQEKVSEAFRKLFKTEGPLLEKAKAIAEQNGIDENVMAMCDSIIKSSQHRFGRYLELSRRTH